MEKFTPEDARFMTSAELNRIVDNTVLETEKRCAAEWKKKILKVSGKIAIAIIILTLLATAVNKIIDNSQLNNEIVSVGFDDSVVTEGMHYNPDTDKTSFNQKETVEKLIAPENIKDLHINIFKTYKKVKSQSNFGDAEIKSVMDDVISTLNYRYEKDYGVVLINGNSWAEYVKNNGVVDKEGNPDYGAYVALMEDYCEKISDINSVVEGTFLDENNPNVGGR